MTIRKHPLAVCEDCPLYNRPFVPSEIHEHALYTIIGEAPGYEEVKGQKPFIGKSGDLLNDVIHDLHLHREDFNILNAASCQPVENDDPPDLAIACCNKRLQSEIKTDTIITMGKFATAAYKNVNPKNVHITKIRGQRQGQFMPTVHPAYVLRFNDSYVDLVRDIKNVLVRPDVYSSHYVIADSVELSNFSDLLCQENFSHIAYDVETTGLNEYQDDLFLIQFYHPTFNVVIVEFDPNDQLQSDLLNLIFDTSKTGQLFVAHNAKFDNQFLRVSGIKPPQGDGYEDTMLLSYMLDERPSSVGLKTVACTLLNVEDWENELNEYKKKHRIQNYKLIPKEILYPYAARDVVYTWHIYEKLKHAKTEFPNLYHKEIKPMSILVEKQRGLGIRIDMQKIEEVHQILEDEEISLQTKIRVASDSKVKNPRSTLQVRNFLFKELKLPPVKATLGGEDSTDRETIDILTEDYPDVEFLQLLKDHRDVSRIRSSYIEKIRDMAAFVGRIHPDFRLAGTLTGRLSDSLLLLLPRRQKNKYSAYVRSLFIADPGYVFFYADFDQKELRVLACEAQEPLYKMIFESGDDPHSQLADLLYGPEWRQKPNAKEWRTWAKNTNYADKYGGGLKKLAKTAHTTISRVKQALASYEAVELWKKEIYNQVLTKGYLQTHFERRRRYEFITKRTWPEIQRQAVNFMIQSTANSINFHCALKIDQLPNVHVLMTQHDSIQALIPEDHLELAEEAIQIMKHLPGQIYSTYVPFNAEMGLGHSWAEAEEKT